MSFPIGAAMPIVQLRAPFESGAVHSGDPTATLNAVLTFGSAGGVGLSVFSSVNTRLCVAALTAFARRDTPDVPMPGILIAKLAGATAPPDGALLGGAVTRTAGAVELPPPPPHPPSSSA